MLSKEYLENEYTQKERRVEDIAQELHCSKATVYNHMKKFGIGRRRQYTDLTGKQFGRWVVEGFHSYKNGHTLWQCRCTCGSIVVVHRISLIQKDSTKCRQCADIAHRSKEEYQRAWFNRTEKEAAHRKIPFIVSYEYLLELYLAQDKKCALSGLPIIFAKTHEGQPKSQSTASLDRVDSGKGYAEGNVQWVHKKINRMKGTFTEKRFLDLCQAVTQKAQKE